MSTINIDVYDHLDKDLFNKIVANGKPAVIRNIWFGDCMSEWTPQYLMQHLSDTTVKVHVCNEPKLDFINKNFRYESITFNNLIDRCLKQNSNEYLYLRSLGNDRHGKDISNIIKHFPQIACDVEMPSFLPFVTNDHIDEEVFFSSVLRISSPNTVLWTHYDIMDNILLQIRGRKRVVLFPPEDINYLYLCGDKSSVIDIDAPIDELSSRFPLFLNVSRYETILEDGDALFIPSLWFHNVKSLEFSIAINFFWKDKQIAENKLYNQTDVYGNKDLNPASFAFANLDKAIKHIDKLPLKFKQFYLRVMMNKINDKLVD